MQTRKWVLALVLVVLMAAPAARADWDMGDPHKMHFPQMPGPNAAQIDYWPWVADDWKCSQTGPVDDIHFWIMEGGFTANTVVNVRIYSDDRSGAFSLPGQLLWSHDFNPGQYTLRNWAGTPLPAQQVNIQNIPDPFLQTKDTMYWLALTATGTGPNGASWLTGSPQFEDVAVHWNTNGWTRYGEGWEAYSFVITPEPATLSLLALGGAALLRRKRREPQERLALPRNHVREESKMDTKRTIGVVLMVSVFLANAATARAAVVNFDEFTSPPVTGLYATTGVGGKLVYPGVTIDGGVVLDNSGWAGMATSGANLYGTSDYGTRGFPMFNPITLTFAGPVSGLSLDVINGYEAATFTLSVFDASQIVIGSASGYLAGWTKPGSVGSFSVSYSGIYSATVSSSQALGSVNYAIDTISFIPEPATLSLLALGGLAVLRRRRMA